MIFFPNAKINLGLRILNKRQDGFHNISSFFIPIKLCDVLEVQKDITLNKTQITYSGLNFVNGLAVNAETDLVIKAYNLLKNKFSLPPLKIHLHKNIPSSAGLGGGSSDGTFMLLLLNKLFNLKLSQSQLVEYAKKLGSDCVFFLYNQFSYVTGLGEKITPLNLNIPFRHIVIIKPDFSCSTRDVFNSFKLKKTNPFSIPKDSLEIQFSELYNDFETVVFNSSPESKKIKDYLKSLGAQHVSMSGSGSAIYALFEEKPIIKKSFNNWIWEGTLM